jgi:hypothetical protein
MIKVFTLYYDRFETATTSLALKKAGIEHTILLHNNKNKFNNIHGEVIETNNDKGIQNNLNFGLDLIKQGEWAIFLSDDYKKSFKLNEDKTRFVKCNLKYVYSKLIETINIADKIGVKLIGLNCTGNALFSKNKFGKYGLVDGRMFAIKKTNFEWRHDISCITDYYASLYHLKKYGGNLILNECYAEFERYAEDGIGTVQNRADAKKKDIKILKNLYPNNIKIKDKLNQPKGTHITINR